MKLMVIIGSVREGRAAEYVSRWAIGRLQQDKELELDVADLKDVDLPFFNEAASPEASHDTYQNQAGTAWAKRVAAADAYLLITPEYNYGTSAVLKNALDWTYYGWNYKPVGFISYGGPAGGTRAVQQLRQNVLNLKMIPIAFSVHIPLVGHAFNEQGQPKEQRVNDNLDTVAKELKDMQQRLAE